MKIIHVISSLGNGGAENFIVELANELSIKNEVTLVSFRSINDNMLPPKKINKKVNLITVGKKEGFDLIIIPKLLKLIKKIKPDIIHSHLDSTFRYIYILSLLYSKCNYFQTIHYYLDDNKIRLFNKLKFLPFYKQRFTNICISHKIFQVFKNIYPGLKFAHIDNGIKKLEPTSKFPIVTEELDKLRKNREKIFIAIGRFDYHKNFSMLVNVFKRLKDNNYDVKLLIIGGNPSTERTEIDHINYIKGDNTYLLGPRQNVADYLLNADALVMSSRSEGMPIVVIEAMSVGLPVISTPAGGVVDLIKNGINGYIANSIEEDDFYNAMTLFLNSDETSIIKFRENNLNYYNSNLTMNLCAHRYEALYIEGLSTCQS